MRTPISRISCTIPAHLVAAADQMAAREQRSRSWVIAESLRRWFAETESGAARSLVPAAPAEAVVAVRRRHRGRSLDASPQARLAEAEALGAKERGARPRRLGASVISFDALLDHAAWQAANRRHG